MTKITEQLIRHEGLRLTPYRCPAGRLTIGVGRNLEEKGISEQEAMVLLENDINECIADLQTIFDDDPARFDNLPSQVQNVLVDMRFNIGPNGFRSFTNMIRAVKENDFSTAALEMKDSGMTGPAASRPSLLHTHCSILQNQAALSWTPVSAL